MSIMESVTEQPNVPEQQTKAVHQDGQQVNGNGVEAIENGVNNLQVEAQQGQGQGTQPEGDLHAFCAEGSIEEVRNILSRGLESLETLDLATGCTPIVLAIRGNHVEVVRELLSAGAIVPPPGLTSDPLMLSVLYPQPMYGMPPPYGQPMSMPPDFYQHQNGFYPGPPDGRFVPYRKESSPSGNGNGQAQGQGTGSTANLPPAEVSKTIPCRNFPNCKYGSNCVFFHPLPRPFYPGHPSQNGGYAPNGYDGSFQPNFSHIPQQPYFVPNGFNPAFAPQSVSVNEPTSDLTNNTNGINDHTHTDLSHQQTQSHSASNETQDIISQHLDTPTSPIPVTTTTSHLPSAIAPVFVPGYPAPSQMGSPPPPSNFGLSPLSPSMLAGSLPSIPPAEAFFAQSPPTGIFQQSIPNGYPNNRRQSFGQAFGVMQGVPKTFHGKKPSFSGGPRPFGGRPSLGQANGANGNGSNGNGNANLGQWKDGVPPPCAFFSQGKCRNGEFCKFPHLDESGNDCRHPDVVRGIIPPLPSLGRQRTMRMNGGPGYGQYDPNFRGPQLQYIQQQQQQLPNQYQSIQSSVQPIAEDQVNGVPEATQSAEQKLSNDVNGHVDGAAENDTPTADSESAEKPALPASIPAKPTAPMPSIVRSASQPGVQRVHANGFSSRSHSPAPSNVSFHGNGHPRRGGSRVPFPNGNRSSSQGEARVPVPAQRVPGADEFPALGGVGGGGQTSPNPGEVREGKTAAQVLSEPAPAKPVPVEEKDDAQSIKSDRSVSMESESDSDAIIVTHRPSASAAPVSTSPRKRGSVSFASVISSATASTPAEPASVGVQA